MLYGTELFRRILLFLGESGQMPAGHKPIKKLPHSLLVLDCAAV